MVSLSASLYGQKLDFSFNDSTVESVLKKISEQTEYKFVYSDALSAIRSKVSVEADNEEATAFFKRFFPEHGIVYKVDKNQVLLSNKQITQNGDEVKPPVNNMLSGTVVDDANQPIIGASVVNKTRNIGVATFLGGSFKLRADEGDAIQVSHLGYDTYEMIVGKQTDVSIVLTPSSERMDEVVVVGYGTAKKSTMVGSVNTISNADITLRPVTSVGAVLYGAAPGMMVTSAGGIPGDDPNIRIRGFGTINSSSSPIYVVDGAVFDISLRTVNPQDIESISILKDASATAIYGSRGANGVIMITTKKGREGKLSFSVNLREGVNMRFVPEYEMVSSQDYYQLMYEAKRNSLYYNPTLNMDMATANRLAATGGSYGGSSYISTFDDLGGVNPFYGIDNNEIIDPVTGQLNPAATRLKWGDDTDWFSPMARVGLRTDLTMSASGGTEKSDYYASLNYLRDNSWMKRSFTNRISARANVNFKPLKWLKIGSNLSGSIVNSYNQSWSGDGTDNPFFVAHQIGSIYPVYLHDQITGAYILDADGKKIYDKGGGQVIDGISYPSRPAQGGNRNIVAEIMADDQQYRRNSLQSRTYAEVSFLDGFKFTVNANISYSPYSGYSYSSNEIGALAPSGSSSRSERTNSAYTYQQLLSYNKTFKDKHELDVVAGHESFETLTKQVSVTRTGQIMSGNIELTNFTTITQAVSSRSEYKTEGYFARANYSYDRGRYSFEVSYRRDGTSKFYRDVRWGDFWSVGGGWNIASEPFMKKVKVINILKLRASYGTTGNLEGIGNYNWQDVYLLNHNNQAEAGYYQDPSAANRTLTWEKQAQFSVALDYSLFNHRLRGSIEYFDKRNDDLLFAVRQPASTGMTTQNQNIGTLYNKGWEISATVDIIRKGDFRWEFGINAATLKNRITKMPADNPEMISGTKKLKVGHSIYDFWMRDWYGVDPRDGATLYRLSPDAEWSDDTCRVMENGDQVTTSHDTSKAQYVYAGSAIPDLYGSFQTTFDYKGISLTTRFGYQIGGKMYDSMYASVTTAGRYGYSLHKDMTRRWQKAGDITDVPRMDNTNATVYNVASTRYLISASYLVLNSANLSYTFPSKIVEKMKLGSLQVSLSGENLFLLSKRRGMNPMESFSGGNSSSYTPSRVLTFGISLTL
jgi:TonB-linked SusC/RagA family outer membrane protein